MWFKSSEKLVMKYRAASLRRFSCVVIQVLGIERDKEDPSV